MKFSFHTDPRFIHMFHRCLCDRMLHGPGKALVGVGAPCDPVDNGPLGYVHTRTPKRSRTVSTRRLVGMS